jgi:PIN domain nuclease of toxin-antitoxin system
MLRNVNSLSDRTGNLFDRSGSENRPSRKLNRPNGNSTQRALAEPRSLDRETRATIESGDIEILFSAASIWEIAIKATLGRDAFAFDPAEIARVALDIGFSELPVRARAAALVGRLPLLHRDPFDRLLVAQAMAEPATLYTADQQLVPYSNLVRHIGASQP